VRVGMKGGVVDPVKSTKILQNQLLLYFYTPRLASLGLNELVLLFCLIGWQFWLHGSFFLMFVYVFVWDLYVCSRRKAVFFYQVHLQPIRKAKF